LLLLLKKNLPDVTGVSADEIGEPTDLEVVSRGPSGRNTLLKVETDKRVLQVAGDNIRRVLRQPDGSMLPSTLFDLSAQRGGASGVSIVARGRGFGHGLGLCQHGAIARAVAGQNYRDILNHYFPKADLTKLY
jgi:stage II sporulation protein D